jgi:hypothetical protein
MKKLMGKVLLEKSVQPQKVLRENVIKKTAKPRRSIDRQVFF